MKIGIVGLGMMGCSLAHALKNSQNITQIIGCDNNEKHLKEATHLNLIDSSASLDEVLELAQVVFLVIPPQAIMSTLQNLSPLAEQTTVIDFSSVKKSIVECIPSHSRANFVACHPMCGNEKSGPKGYQEDLYKNKTLIVCDKEESGAEHLQKAMEIFVQLQMNIVEMDSLTHDIHIGFVSHLPHMISFTLANSVLKQEDPSKITQLRGGGFESMSRIAKSNPSLWVDIFKHNHENLSIALDAFEEEYKIARSYFQNKQWDKLGKWIEHANKLEQIL